MTIYFIRHGEPDYSFIKDNMNCQWSNLAPLTSKGIKQATNLREEKYLKEFTILSSPYTRAFQTASIFAEGKNIIIEPMLHEWLPSTKFDIQVKDIPIRNNYFKTNTQNVNYETKEEMINRMNFVLNKYKDEDNLVIFAHSRLICTYLQSIGINKKYLNYCEIVKVGIEQSEIPSFT